MKLHGRTLALVLGRRGLAIALMAFLLSLLALPSTAYGAGALDPTFGADGMVTTPVGPVGSVDSAQALAVQPDGKFVAAGTSGGDFALVRYNPDGRLDSTFDGDGKVTTAIAAGSRPLPDVARAVVIQTDGKIVVAGRATEGGHTGITFFGDFAVARYNPNGTLDTTFDGDGKVTTNIIGDDNAYGLALQPDGKLVVAGGVQGWGFALIRYNADGSLDTTFDGDGKVTTKLCSASFCADGYRSADLAIQPDGKLVVVGNLAVDDAFALARYNPNGSLDTTFDGDGKVTTTFGNGAWAAAVVIQPDGKIVAAGGGFFGSVFALARYNTDGGLDTSFDGDGKVTTDVGDGDAAQAVALQSDGKLVAAGYASEGANQDFALARYNPNGSLDTGFDADGKVTTAIAPDWQDDEAEAVAIQPDGKAVAAGYADMGPPEYLDNDFVLVRYNPDGDTAPPQTTIDTGPSGTTNDPTPTFTFSSSEPGSTFECRVDGGSFTPCTSPHTTAVLADGSHTFEVRARDSAGNVDPTPASRSFTVATVDTTPPGTTIDSGPSGTTTDPTPTFTFSSSEPGSTLECRVDGGSFTPCTSPHTTAVLADGSHTFEVRARDSAGNVDPTAASRSFTVDATSPSPPAPLSAPAPTLAPWQPAPSSALGTGTPSAFGTRTLVTLTLARSRINSNGRLAVRVRNANDFAVSGKLYGRTLDKVSSSKRRRIKLKNKAFSVGAYAKRTVRVNLPKTLRRHLKRRGRIRLRLSTRVEDRAGHTRTVNKRVTVRSKRKRKRGR